MRTYATQINTTEKDLVTFKMNARCTTWQCILKSVKVLVVVVVVVTVGGRGLDPSKQP